MDNELLAARIRDTAEICERTSKPKFLGFLTPDEKAAAQHILKSTDCKAEYFGGYDEAQRVILGCFPYSAGKYAQYVTEAAKVVGEDGVVIVDSLSHAWNGDVLSIFLRRVRRSKRGVEKFSRAEIFSVCVKPTAFVLCVDQCYLTPIACEAVCEI